jgi:signal peptidase I
VKIFGKILKSFSIAIVTASSLALLLFGWSGTGWKALIIPTGSMRPSINPGSIVFVHKVPVSSLKVGDVITYTNPFSPKTTISHRIVKEYTMAKLIPAFVTKGDANKAADVAIVGGSIKGKVVWHFPYIGGWLLRLKKPIIILPVIYLAALIIMGGEVGRLNQYYNSIRPYRLRNASLKTPRTKLQQRTLLSGAMLSIAFVSIGATVEPTVFASLKSNTVTLGNNSISSGVISKCSGFLSNNSVNISTGTTQNAQTGNVTDSVGNLSSGNAINNNSSNFNIQINNC